MKNNQEFQKMHQCYLAMLLNHKDNPDKLVIFFSTKKNTINTLKELYYQANNVRCIPEEAIKQIHKHAKHYMDFSTQHDLINFITSLSPEEQDVVENFFRLIKKINS